MEPERTCDACGAVGTVGRVFRRGATDAPINTQRFCLACWPSESERVTAQWEQDQAARLDEAGHEEGSTESIHQESATWDNAVFLVTGIEAALQSEDSQKESITKESLAQFAEELATSAPEMVSPMPGVIARFIQQYRCAT